jgi:hypothetical protein
MFSQHPQARLVGSVVQSARPINWAEFQATPIHFFAKFLSVLLGGIAHESIPTTRVYQIGFNLAPNVLVIHEEIFVF